jgi:GntR family transcriptional regulator
LIDFRLDPKSGVPFYRQIIDQIRYGIASGRLEVGEQLPTVRALAVKLKVNLNTVSKAYKELEIKQIIETQQGTGSFIGTQEINLPDRERENKLKNIVNEFTLIASSYGFTIDDLTKMLKRGSED